MELLSFWPLFRTGTPGVAVPDGTPEGTANPRDAWNSFPGVQAIMAGRTARGFRQLPWLPGRFGTLIGKSGAERATRTRGVAHRKAAWRHPCWTPCTESLRRFRGNNQEFIVWNSFGRVCGGSALHRIFRPSSWEQGSTYRRPLDSTTHVLLPPKPNELDTATRTGWGKAWCGT